MNSGIDFASILSETDENEEQTDTKRLRNKNIENVRSNSISPSKGSTVSITSMPSKRNVAEMSEVETAQKSIKLEERTKRNFKGTLLINYLKSAKHPFVLAFLVLSFVLTQILASGADMFVPYW